MGSTINTKKPDRMLVRFKNKILPLCQDSIALFHLDNSIVKLVTFDSKVYFVSLSLEDLQEKLGESFYRVNRQFLINKDAILDLTTAGKRSITVNLHIGYSEEITVSKHKYGEFLNWLV